MVTATIAAAGPATAVAQGAQLPVIAAPTTVPVTTAPTTTVPTTTVPTTTVPTTTVPTTTVPPTTVPPPALAACPGPPDSSYAVPPAEPGVYQSSAYPQNALFGANIVGLGVVNPYYEFGVPTDGVHTSNPLGVMLIVHGGGWAAVGPGMVAGKRPDADFWRAHGWATLNIDYRACPHSIGDVYGFYVRLRQVVGRAAIVCASGDSAGAHLSMVLAALSTDPTPGRPGPLACVISAAGITDINGLNAESAYPSGNDTMYSAHALFTNAEIAFGTTDPAILTLYSPMNYASLITAPMLLATGTNDVLIPQSQATAFRDAIHLSHPTVYIDVAQLPCPSLADLLPLCDDTIMQPGLHTPGAQFFIHGMTTQAGMNDFQQREIQLVNQVLPSH